MPGPYKRGQPVNLVERFYVIDPLTHAKTLADPTTVTFTLDQPDNTTLTYVFGIDANVTKPMVGVYVCALGVLDPPGIFTYECVGTGAVQATSGVKTFQVLDDTVLPPPDESEFTMYGPCTSWIDGSDVLACYTPAASSGVDPWELDDEAAIASQLLYEVSGRQFPGICERTVRPCKSSCGCWGIEQRFSPWFWAGNLGGLFGGWWWNECGDKCGCGTESYIRLAGYPVREIINVKLDGVIMNPAEYRLDQRYRLIRLPDPANPTQDQFWPSCQDLSLADDQPGTISVTYKWGTPPPELGKRAAAQLAGEIWAACTGGAECQLPSKVTKVVRQGLTVDRILTTAELLRSGGSGLPMVDYFIAMVNPQGMKRRPAVFSPDLQPFARKLGQ